MDFKESLIALEYHAVFDIAVLIEVHPGSVCALTALEAIGENPVAPLAFDCRLGLAQKLVLDADVAIGSPANHYLLVFVLAAEDVRLLGTDYRENLEPEALWWVRLCNYVVLGQDEVSHNVRFSHIEQLIISQYDRRVQLDKGAIANSQIFYFVLERLGFEKDLELSPAMLFFFFFILSRDHEIIDDFLLSALAALDAGGREDLSGFVRGASGSHKAYALPWLHLTSFRYDTLLASKVREAVIRLS